MTENDIFLSAPETWNEKQRRVLSLPGNLTTQIHSTFTRKLHLRFFLADVAGPLMETDRASRSCWTLWRVPFYLVNSVPSCFPSDHWIFTDMFLSTARLTFLIASLVCVIFGVCRFNYFSSPLSPVLSNSAIFYMYIL